MKKITIKIKGGKIICRHNGLTQDSLEKIMSRAIAKIDKAPSFKSKLFRRIIVKKKIADVFSRFRYICSAIRQACSASFNKEDINRHQYDM
ncbi:MAG: hypothetical protein ACI4HO_09220 [Ruminococcus sp.]